MSGGPLSGLIVLDLTQFLAGPYGTQILGDLGARIIKIEPTEGEMTRGVPPHFHRGESAYFLSVNRNKESLALDLKSKRGREIFLDLVAKADAVIENFRPGVMDRFDLGFPVLKAANPHIVVCAISGFGQDGPYRDLPAYDIIVQAMSGGMSITGQSDGEPVRAGVPIGDLCAGLFSVVGLLSHLLETRSTRKARYIDVSMLDCQISMLSYQAAYYLHSGQVPGRQGRAHDSIPTYRAFRCSDGKEIVVAANTEAMWRSLCQAIGLPELIDDPRFRLNRDRLENRDVLEPLLERQISAMPADAVLEKLMSGRVPAGPINDLEAALSDPQVLHRNMIACIDDGAGGSIRVAGNPIHILESPPESHVFPPTLGSGTRKILADLLDFSDADTDRLIDAGVVRATP